MLFQCPALKSGPDGKPLDFQEDFALEAQYFTESRLLQRDVKIVLESSNNKTFVGSVIHPNGNIAEVSCLFTFKKPKSAVYIY